MQEQVQVEKDLTFEDIVPEWSDILAQNGGFIENRRATFEAKDGDRRTIMNCANCLVGEAHSGA